jgi:hypothetical protein
VSPVPSCIGKVQTFLRLFFLFPFEDKKENNGHLHSANTKLWVMFMGSLSRQVDELQGVVEELKSEACAKQVDLNLTAQVAAVEEEQRQNAQLIADLKLELQQVK